MNDYVKNDTLSNYRTKDDLTVGENDELVKKSSLDTILEDFPTIDDVNDTLSTNYALKSDIPTDYVNNNALTTTLSNYALQTDIPDLSNTTIMEVENRKNITNLIRDDVDIIINETTAEIHFKYKLHSTGSNNSFSVILFFNNDNMTLYRLNFSILDGIYNGIDETYIKLPPNIEYNVQSLDETNTKYNNSYYLKITTTNYTITMCQFGTVNGVCSIQSTYEYQLGTKTDSNVDAIAKLMNKIKELETRIATLENA